MEPVVGSARLFAAFEKLGQSPGADLRSGLGPGGNPAEALIRAFEDAMTSPAVAPDVGMTRGTGTIGEKMSISAVPGPAEAMPSPESGRLLRINAPGSPERVYRQGGHGVDPARSAGTMPSPVELYQAQYQAGLLRAQVSVAVNSSQSLTQSLETALKQSG